VVAVLAGDAVCAYGTTEARLDYRSRVYATARPFCYVYIYNRFNRRVATVCCKSARHWLTAAPYQLHDDNRWVWRRPRPAGHMTAVVFQMNAGDNC